MAVVQEQLFPSPLRYPGGKGQLANYVKLIMLQNGLVGGDYVEPYAGGASVALMLLFEEYAGHIHINDLNPGVAAFWRAVLSDPEEMCRRIEACDISVDEWRRQRAIQDSQPDSDVELGFSTFYLNRTSRSGIIGGGVIGGLNQTGNWKIDARFNRSDLARRIKRIGRFRNRITVTQIDASEYISNHVPAIQPALVYLDPPYFVKGEGLYQHFYTDADHAEVARLAAELDAPCIVSYDAAPEIEALYTRWRGVRYGLNYSAQGRYEGTEAMFFSDDLQIPEVDSPAKVSGKTVDLARLAA